MLRAFKVSRPHGAGERASACCSSCNVAIGRTATSCSNDAFLSSRACWFHCQTINKSPVIFRTITAASVHPSKRPQEERHQKLVALDRAALVQHLPDWAGRQEQAVTTSLLTGAFAVRCAGAEAFLHSSVESGRRKKRNSHGCSGAPPLKGMQQTGTISSDILPLYEALAAAAFSFKVSSWLT